MQESLEGLRLDIACVRLNLAQTRNKAHALIKEGKICVNGMVCQKSAYKLNSSDLVSSLETLSFISRAGEKLYLFLQDYPYFLEDSSVALDIGSSTGGFCEVLLNKGVESLVCVDVGSNQLHKSLKENAHVKSYENTDIRDFAKSSTQTFPLIVCDVSFISLKEILDSIYHLARNFVILLFKPQFEVGKEAKRNKKGVVKDKNVILKALDKTLEMLQDYGFKLLVCEESKIKGKEGNVEFFIACQKL